MNRATLAPYPQLSWSGVWSTIGAEGATIELSMRQLTHCLIYTSRAPASVRWVRRCREERFRVDTGTVRFSPADDAEHTLVGDCRPGHRFFTLLIPPGHLSDVAEEEGIPTVPELRHSVSSSDAILTSCLRTLSRPRRVGDGAEGIGQEVAARSLLLRLMAINGGRLPDWRTDGGVFDRPTLVRLVETIDAGIVAPPSLPALAREMGLSASHFARKFRRSTGISLERFIHHRRIRRAMTMLQGETPLPELAVGLGFCSHSHFTRVFSALTGITPSAFRRQFRRRIG